MNTTTELEKLGLSKNQCNIYMLLLKKGTLRISEISQTLEIPRSSVYENLKALFKVGLTEEIIEDSFKYIKASPVSTLRHGLLEKIEELEQQNASLNELEKAISRVSGATRGASAPVIRYYKGRSGARQIFWNSLKAKGTAYIYSDYGRSRYVGKNFYEDFVAESNKREIKEKVMMNTNPATWQSIKRFNYPGSPIARTKVENLRFLDQKYLEIKGDTLIYDNIYAQVYLKNVGITGFEIESTQFADTQRSFYKILWRMAQPLPPTLSEAEQADIDFEADDPHVGRLPIKQ